MNKICKTLLIISLIVSTTGCTFKGSMGNPIDEPIENETSQSQQEIEELIDQDDTLEEKTKEYENKVNEMLEEIKKQENENISE